MRSVSEVGVMVVSWVWGGGGGDVGVVGGEVTSEVEGGHGGEVRSGKSRRSEQRWGAARWSEVG